MSNGRWLPWRDYHQDLTLQHLIHVGNLLRDVWRRCSELHEPTEGDSLWSLSCRAFQRCGYQLLRAQEHHPWLTVNIEQPLRWVISFGMIPVRFYHGDPETVPARYASATQLEKALRQPLLNLNEHIHEGVSLRLATDTDAHGIPITVTLVEYDEQLNVVLNRFVIPEAAASAMPVIQFPQPQPQPGVQQPRPTVRPITGRAQGQTEDDDDR